MATHSTLVGKLADRASIIKSVFSEVEVSVIKATKHNTKSPKEKHVRRLLLLTTEHKSRIPELVSLLAKRLEVPDWIVVMKTLCVFHRLMKDSSSSLIAELRYRSSIFNMKRFADKSTLEVLMRCTAEHQSHFVRKYGQYLEEKVLVFKITNVEFEKDPTVCKSFTTEDSFEKIPRLQSQLNALLNCRSARDHINNNIIACAFTMLLKDSFRLYAALNDAIIALLEHYFNMSRANAAKALDIYKLFIKQTDAMIQFIEISRRFSKSDLPELQHAPTTLVEALENYIKELDEGKNPNPNVDRAALTQSQQNKVMRKQMDDFTFDDPFNDDSDSDDESLSNKNAKKPIDPFAQPAAASNNGNNNPFDPFGGDAFSSTPFPSNNFNSTATKTTTTAAAATPFDPFGSDSFAPSSSSSTAASSVPFDPFGSSSMSTAQPQKVSYDDKKKNVQLMMAATTGSMLTPSPAPAQQPLNPIMTTSMMTTTPMMTPNPMMTTPMMASNPMLTPNPMMNTNPFVFNSQPQTNNMWNTTTTTATTTTTNNSFNPFLQPNNTNTNPFG